jgi:hypothetical protein
MLHTPGSDLQCMQGVILKSRSNNEIIIRKDCTIMKDNTSLLPVDLHHTTIKDPNSVFKHDASKFMVRVCCTAGDQGKMMRVMIFQTTRCQKSEGVEKEMRNIQKAL